VTDEELELIEEAYETRIGPDATTVRALLAEVRRLQEELASCFEPS
jgi:Ni,Fe-hydrogenase III large subunit